MNKSKENPEMLVQHYFKVNSLEEALGIAKEYEEDFRYLAGGTDLVINKFQGNESAACLIDLSNINDLKNVKVVGEALHIGAMVKLDDLKKSQDIVMNFPTLIEAAHSVASPMLRKTATLGGNVLCENRCVFYNQSEWWREAVGYCLKCDGDVCIATGGKKNCFSKFVSDTAPVLIALNAKIELVGSVNRILVPLENIYTGDGLNPRRIDRTGIIASIQLPLESKYKCVFKKLRPREAVDFTSLSTAVSLNEAGTVRVVLGGVDPKPIVVDGASLTDQAELINQAVKTARIVDNDFYSRIYRKEMISVFLEESFDMLNNAAL